MISYSILLIILIVSSRVYFSLAERFNIVDKPNSRSSHIIPTIRGGGVIFIVSLLFWFVVNEGQYPWFFAGAMLLGIVSFRDDIKPVPATIRFTAQLVAFAMLTYELRLDQSLGPWGVFVTLVIGIGTINAFNFMDGINGITGVYALVCLFTLLYVDLQLIDFSDSSLLYSLILCVFVFLFYNFRLKARCFAGDVGSVSLSFMMIFLILQLMVKSGAYGWFVFFSVYAVDSISTIVYRLFNKENIFKAHRTHLYQFLANEFRVSHLWVSGMYGFVQIMVNIIVIQLFEFPSLKEGVLITLCIAFVYLIVRESVLYKLRISGIFNRIFSSKQL